MLQAKVHTIYFIHDWEHPVNSLQKQYLSAQSKFPGGVRKVEVEDPEAEWANGDGPRKQACFRVYISKLRRRFANGYM
jgi:hypothetical protein